MHDSPYFKNHNPAHFKQLTPDVACLVSNRVSVGGSPIHYMAKEGPDNTWVFYAGDENQAYTNNAKNFQLFSLNTIANIDPSILPFLSAPAGTAFEKLQNKWRQVVD